MMSIPRRPSPIALVLGALVLVPVSFPVLFPVLFIGACGSTGSPEPEPILATSPPATSPVAAKAEWTERFSAQAILVADEIEVEGPRGLLSHFVLRQETEFAKYATETTERGLEQSLVRHDGAPAIELRAQLDAWVLVAAVSIRALERPGEVPVIVRGRGNAVWRPVGTQSADAVETFGGGERRGPVIEFRVDVPER